MLTVNYDVQRLAAESFERVSQRTVRQHDSLAPLQTLACRLAGRKITVAKSVENFFPQAVHGGGFEANYFHDAVVKALCNVPIFFGVGSGNLNRPGRRKRRGGRLRVREGFCSRNLHALLLFETCIPSVFNIVICSNNARAFHEKKMFIQRERTIGKGIVKCETDLACRSFAISDHRFPMFEWAQTTTRSSFSVPGPFEMAGLR
jgi:hypothetical protein